MPIRNTLGDMHNILMAQLERLDLVSGDEIKSEIERTRSMAELATAINSNAKTMMEAMRLKSRVGGDIPPMLTSDNHG